jgi:hypothetical protein
MNKKEETVKTYDQSASALAEKFAKIGRRISDIERGLSYVKKVIRGYWKLDVETAEMQRKY